MSAGPSHAMDSQPPEDLLVLVVPRDNPDPCEGAGEALQPVIHADARHTLPKTGNTLPKL